MEFPKEVTLQVSIDSPMESRYRDLKGFSKGLAIAFTLVGLFLAVYQIFHVIAFGFTLMENSYLYMLLAFFLSLSFLFFPLKKAGPWGVIFIFDFFLCIVTFFICLYFAWHGYDIIYKGWGYLAPTHVTVMAVALWVLVLEGVRRTSGIPFTLVIFVFSLYPLFASHMPGFLEGYSRSFVTTAAFHALSTESILGIPLGVFGSLLVGFLVFGVSLQATGGGTFFLDLSFSLLGSHRGGTAKVAVLASALFGTLSGSAISNVVTTGSITIPAMKKTGYPPHYAGAIECAASTGGVLMPPVMGTTAFVMAAFLGKPYYSIALAAAVPSILYYLGLLVQVDGFAARHKLTGLAKTDIPPLKKVLKEGWFYLIAVFVLMYFLFSLRLESQAPFYTLVVLLALAMIRKETRFTYHKFLQFILMTGRLLSELIAILAAVGMILGSLALTGVAAAFAREIVSLAGGNLMLLLIMGAFASFILGMGMTITACYIFLAMVLAPTLVAKGLNELAVHLFLLYWGMISFITPPVALAAYPAAVIASSSPFKVGLYASKLGGVNYFVPFFFVLDPALILQGQFGDIFQAVLSAALGVFLIGSVLEGYIVGIGDLKVRTAGGFVSAASLLVSGILLAFPGSKTDIIGFVIAAVTISYILIMRWLKKEIKPDTQNRVLPPRS